jgi:ethanolaminephosphotransferase
MKSSGSWLPLAVINLLLPIGILIFAKGFFPYKPVFPGLATFDDASPPPPPPPFNKLVFMVVDALRRYLPRPPCFAGLF